MPEFCNLHRQLKIIRYGFLDLFAASADGLVIGMVPISAYGVNNTQSSAPAIFPARYMTSATTLP